MRKVASQTVSRLREEGHADTEPRSVAAMLQVIGHQLLFHALSRYRIENSIWPQEFRKVYDVGMVSMGRKSPTVNMAHNESKGIRQKAGLSGLFFDSSCEHSVVEQLNPGVESVSTTKIIALANRRGIPLCFGVSNNIEQVASAVVNYTTAQMEEFKTHATRDNYFYLFPQNGSISLNQWTGTGWVFLSNTWRGMMISGGLYGGNGTTEAQPDFNRYIEQMNPVMTQNRAIDESTQADPVSMPSGAYLDQMMDLALSRYKPLTWARSYDSRNEGANGALGRGWTHSFEMSIVESTDADAFLGSTSVEALLPTLVGMAVADAVVSNYWELVDAEIARRWTIAAIIADWWASLIPQSCVCVKTGASSLSFQKMPDGSYAPYPGVTATLTKNASGLYVLQTRLGNTYRFNAQNKLQEIEDTCGNKTRLVYSYDVDDSGRLIRVENDFDAAFDLTWENGRISKVTDNAGRTVEYTYDSDGCMISSKDVRGKLWTMTYDPMQHTLVSKTDPDNQRLILNTYNSRGQVTNQVSDVGGIWELGYAENVSAWNKDALGYRLTQYFDAEGRVLRTVNRDGTETHTTYDGHGHNVLSVDEAGDTTHFEYDDKDNLVQIAQWRELSRQVTCLKYDEQNRLAASVDALGYTNRFAYNNAHLMTRLTLADGSYIENNYDNKGLLQGCGGYAADGTQLLQKTMMYNNHGLPISQTVYGRGLPTGGITTSCTYSPLGLPTSKTDARGNTWTMEYDPSGVLLSTTNPLGNTTRFTYTDAGYLRTTTDALNHTTTQLVTPSGKRAATIYPDGRMSTNRYDAMDNLVGVTDARGANASFFYDAVGQMVGMQTASGSSSTVYDERGNVVQTTDASGVSSFVSYDAFGRPVEARNALGAKWTTAYDALNRPVSFVNPLGKKRKTVYDVMGRTVATFAPSGAKDAFGYDADGNMTSYTNAESHVYKIGYDALGRVVAMTNALGVEVCYNVYDLGGNLISSTDGNGAMTTFTYDALNRLTSKAGNGFSSAFGHDAVGNMTTAENGTGRETFVYDVCNQLVAATATFGSASFALAYGRDAGGLITNITYASGKQVTREYDADGQLVKVKDWLGHEWRFAYDGAGKMTQTISPNGIAATYAYDAAGQLSEWRIGDIAGRSIERNQDGQRIADTVTVGAMPRINREVVRQNTFNDANQLVSSSNDQGQNVESFTYDNNGALTAAVANNGSIQFTYNGAHQITAITTGRTTD